MCIFPPTTIITPLPPLPPSPPYYHIIDGSASDASHMIPLATQFLLRSMALCMPLKISRHMPYFSKYWRRTSRCSRPSCCGSQLLQRTYINILIGSILFFKFSTPHVGYDDALMVVRLLCASLLCLVVMCGRDITLPW